MRPPRPYSWLLRLVRDAVAREAVSGDLQEELQRVACARGNRAARRWYRRAVVRSLMARLVGGRAARPQRGAGLGSGIGADLRLGLRMLRKDPSMIAMAVGALGLGIGLSTVGFAVLYGSVMRGLPFERAHELVHFERARPSEGQLSLAVTPHDYEAWRAQSRSFVDLGAYVEALFLIGDGDGLTQQHWGVAISANSFALLGVEPVLGRTFLPEEDRPGGAEVMVIGHGIWQSRFGGDPEIVGRSVRVNGVDTRIVGVMPPEFGFPIAERFWRPLRLDTGAVERGSGRLDVFARLRADVSLQQARDDMSRVSASLAEAFPATNAGIQAQMRTFNEEYVGAEFEARVWTMLAAALLVALLASVNVATLLLARATRRIRELAVRTALGAGRARIARQLFVETTVLVAFGAVIGIGVAVAGTALFERYWAGTAIFALPHGPDAPFWWRYGVDLPVLGFVLAVTAATSLVAGLLPALRVSSANAGELLKDEGRGSTGVAGGRLGRGLVVAEVALCTALLVCAGLVVRSIATTRGVGEGITTEGLYSASAFLPGATVFSGGQSRVPTEREYADVDAQLGFWAELGGRLAASPDLDGYALTTALPVDGAGRVEFVLPRDEAGEPRSARAASITPAFFELLGADLLRGRPFDDGDSASGEPVVIVNASFAARHFGGAEALNQRMRLGGDEGAEPWLTVVGVAPDLWMDGARNRDREGLYLPLAQAASADPAARLGRFGLRYVDLLVRPRGESSTALLGLRRAVAELDAEVPIYDSGSMSARIAQQTDRFRVHGSFYLTLGAVALLLAALGLYAVVSHIVGSRTQEIGTRIALGADASSILRLVLGQGMRPVLLGAAVGLLLSSWLQPPLQRILYGVEPWDPLATAGVVVVLLVTGVAACWSPARRASRVDPIDAMRSE